MTLEHLWLIPIGVAVGAYGTIIGAGGGFVLVPLLVLLYPDERRDTIASMSLAVVFFNALSGTFAYARMRRIHYRSGISFSLATIPGAILGAVSTQYMNRTAFDAILGAVLLGICAFLLAYPLPQRKGAVPERMNDGGHASAGDGDEELNGSMRLGIALSFGVGYLSSLLGIGGGIIHVPTLVHILSYPVHIACATSQFILSITALTGTVTHIAQGAFSHGGMWRTAHLVIGVVVGAQAGALLSSRLHGKWIVRSLAVALGLVAVRILADSVSAAF